VAPEGSDRPGLPRGGRPRDPHVDEAIDQATRALLRERGVGATTIDEIARRAGVARTTVYRRWPNKDALLAHFIRSFVCDFSVPDHGCVRTELVELLAAQLASLQTDDGQLYPTLGAHAVFAPAATEALTEVVSRRRDAIQDVLRRGIDRAQIRGDFDLSLALSVLWGPIYYRFLGSLAGAGPIDRDFVERLVDNLLEGIAIAHAGAQGGGEPGDTSPIS
jgi:AcrR family transcriptional regulator